MNEAAAMVGWQSVVLASGDRLPLLCVSFEERFKRVAGRVVRVRAERVDPANRFWYPCDSEYCFLVHPEDEHLIEAPFKGPSRFLKPVYLCRCHIEGD